MAQIDSIPANVQFFEYLTGVLEDPNASAVQKAAAKEDLDEAMQSMESMLKEYTQMYSGGGAKKEGLKHIENELGSLKQKIQNNVVEIGGNRFCRVSIFLVAD